MNRFLEGIFVISCAVVGFGMGAPEGSGIRNAVNCSVQLIGFANEDIASNSAKIGIHLAEAKAEILGNLVAKNSLLIK